jgi:hypothetical protein
VGEEEDGNKFGLLALAEVWFGGSVLRCSALPRKGIKLPSGINELIN